MRNVLAAIFFAPERLLSKYVIQPFKEELWLVRLERDHPDGDICRYCGMPCEPETFLCFDCWSDRQW
jgi:hypothetical protein